LTLWIAAPSLGISKGSFHLTVADIAPAVRLIIRLNWPERRRETNALPS
jgi:hypothetical protein